MSYYGYDYRFRPRASVAARRRQASEKLRQLEGGGRKTDPVRLEGTKIAQTFWGKAWCENLEAYSDYANRMPRGRSYLRNGSVIDLQIGRGKVTSLVSGSRLYEIEVDIHPLSSPRWKALVKASAGEMLSMVDLLSGRFSEQVMRRFCDQGHGLFPEPSEIKLDCSCPDWAGMCKHVAATLYGVGTRLDSRPELLFTLRGVEPLDLVHAAASAPATVRAPRGGGKVLDPGGLSGIFGIELGQVPPASGSPAKPKSKLSSRPKATKARATVRKPKKRSRRT